ncbi:MAG: nuclear transport factor 2 family protein [Acidobacteriota bacterium]|nr:nuclear transport factor 2 family protein [Acidobacteriota bacterium]
MRRLGPAAEIWQLEIDYWRTIQRFDLVGYRGYWHPNFSGWPHLNRSPQRARGVSGWLADFKSKGRTLASCRLRLEDMQITGNVAIVHYRVAAVWKERSGNATPARYRICHMWLRTGGRWKILGGTSLAEDRLGRAADPLDKPHRRPSRRG